MSQEEKTIIHKPAICAKWLYITRYVIYKGTLMDFWDNLPEIDKRTCRNMVERIECAQPEIKQKDEGYYYTALRNLDKEKLRELFDEKGMCLKEKSRYFKCGDLIDVVLIHQNYYTYPANSDIVRMYYADVYASETHGNYTAQTLYFRSF